MVRGNLILLPTHDMVLVKRLWSDPAIYHQMIDDGCPKNPADWQPAGGERRHYLVPWLDENNQMTAMGIIGYYAISHVMYEVHIGLLPQFQHRMTQEICVAANDWIFTHTPCKKIIAFVPFSKPNVRAIALRCGFKEEGLSPCSFLINGELIDQYILGLERSEHVRNNWRW